jgi:peptide/nickel transport system permease protein
MKKMNLPLVLGSCILIVLVCTMFFPQLLTTVNPYSAQTTRSWSYENGELNLEAPPFAPSEDNPLGTDEMGRDILCLIIYGTKLTLTISILVVMGRFLLAVPLGIAAGFGSYTSKMIIEQCSIIFSALPALLIGVIILKMNFFTNLYKEQSIVAFVLVLTVIDWAKLGKMIMERVQEVLAKPFIKGEIAIGKSRLQISLENVIPHLTAELVILFFMEIARVLTMMMQFGIFGVFVGNMGFIADTEGGQTVFLNISYEPEWASMLGSARNYIRVAPWTVLFPGIAFFISILGFNLVGEGLREQFQEKNSKYLVHLRRLLRVRKFKSPFRKDSIFGRKHLTVVVLITLCVLSATMGVSIWSQHTDAFRYTSAKDLFLHETFDEVLIGTDQGKKMAENIGAALEKIGLEPINENGYLSEYRTEDIYIPVEASLKIQSRTLEKREFVHGEDFVVQSFGDMALSGKLNDASEKDLLSTKDFTQMKDQFILLDSRMYSDKGFRYLAKKMMTESEVKGILCILPSEEALPYPMGKDVYSGVVMWVTPETGETLKQLAGGEVQITMKSKKLESIGRNVVGVIPGNEARIGEEAIIIGVGYNYDQADKKMGEKRILFALELAKKLFQQNHEKSRTIIFVFWDGTLSDHYDGKRAYGKQPLYNPEKSVLYIDLTKLYGDKGEAIYLSSRQAPVTRYFAFGFNHQLENQIRKRNVIQKEYAVDMFIGAKEENYMDKILYYEANTPTIILSMQEDHQDMKKIITLDTLGEILLETIQNNNY